MVKPWAGAAKLIDRSSDQINPRASLAESKN